MIEQPHAFECRDQCECEPPKELAPNRTMMVTELKDKGNIMVVDDQPANLKLLEDMLGQQGYRVRSFPRGRLALAAAVQHPPDLILLDITMPEMNGYDVCRLLKSDKKLAGIPVIFLSALGDAGDKVKAFQSGGVDYVTKPFHLEEVQARVETHLELCRLQQSLQVHNNHLEELVGSRTRELTDAHARLKILDQAKSDFLKLIAHEFRTPLNGVLGVCQLVLEEFPSTLEEPELREMFEQSRRRILTILDDALLLAEIELGAERFAPAPIPLAPVLEAAIEQAAEFARSRGVALDPAPIVAGSVLGIEDILVKAMQTLLETAVKFSEPGETVRITCQSVPEAIRVVIDSCGSTIPAAALPKFFDLFSIGEAITPGGDLGLDAPLAYKILALFGGTLTIENRDALGIRLTVYFKPAAPNKLAAFRID
jgi:two-component system sensor histidine kinase/response regulator